MSRRGGLGGTTREQKALLDRLRPMARKIAKKRAQLGRVLSFEQCWDVAQSALHDALMTWDGAKGDVETHAHATVDHALLDAVATARRRASSPMILALGAMYTHARELRERGNVLHDTEEDTLRHLHDVNEELAGACGVRLTASAEEARTENEVAAAVRDTLKQLSPYEAKIAWMRFAEERKLEDIAHVTGGSIATVHRDLAKAAQRLHALLRRRGIRGRSGEGDAEAPREPPAAKAASIDTPA